MDTVRYLKYNCLWCLDLFKPIDAEFVCAELHALLLRYHTDRFDFRIWDQFPTKIQMMAVEMFVHPQAFQNMFVLDSYCNSGEVALFKNMDVFENEIMRVFIPAWDSQGKDMPVWVLGLELQEYFTVSINESLLDRLDSLMGDMQATEAD